LIRIFECYGLYSQIDVLLFIELVVGSLSHLLFNCPDQMISNERKIEIVRGISRGMLHLHKYDIIHGDLCARNILLTSSGELKISVISHTITHYLSHTHNQV
jgi:tRNA A-37 threonylcarbamoyl transferase component Bud32